MAGTMTFKRGNDERLTILFDGDEVISVNHDQHGSSGMEAAETLAERIAKKLGMEVVDDYTDED